MNDTASRRTFLKAIGAAPLAAGLSSFALAAEENEKPPLLVDTHLHCFAGTGDKRFPYHERGPYQPTDPATPEALLECMAGAGVSYAVVVHPEPYQDDHRYLEYCLEVGKGKLKGTLLVFADRPGSLEKLPDLAKRLDVISVRVHAYAPDRLPPFGKPVLRRLWKLAAENGLAVQLHFEPRYAPGFEPLVKEFKDTRVIIDHLGRPFQGTPEEHAVVIGWGKLPNTIIKLSSIPKQTTYPHRDIRPVIRNLADAYGPERMIYGGGWKAGVTPTEYRAAFERGRSYIAHLSAADQAQILGQNAARLFGFKA
jgi:predicted TIM-barrel fold metal-dependent hydrolase